MGESHKTQVKEKFANEDYPIKVIGRHIDVTEPMKTYAVEKLQKIKRFGGRVIDATIVMDVAKLSHHVDFIINVNNILIKVSGQSENMYASIDFAIERLEGKLRRYHDRLKDHHAKEAHKIEMNVNIVRPTDEEKINDLIEEENFKASQKQHEIVSTKKQSLSSLTEDGALMEIELSGDNFLVYRSVEAQKLKVIYKRNDGNYGIIEIEK